MTASRRASSLRNAQAHGVHRSAGVESAGGKRSSQIVELSETMSRTRYPPTPSESAQRWQRELASTTAFVDSTPGGRALPDSLQARGNGRANASTHNVSEPEEPPTPKVKARCSGLSERSRQGRDGRGASARQACPQDTPLRCRHTPRVHP